MFGRIIYYDKKLIGEYKSLASGRPNMEIEELNVSNEKGVNSDFKILGGDVRASKSYKAKVQESFLFDCDQFEKVLQGRDDYYDFTVSANYDILTVPNRSIIKMDGSLEVPEEFDMVKMIEMFKPFIMEMDQFKEMEESSKIAMQTFLGSAEATKVPVIFEGDEIQLCSKILQENIRISYEEFVETEDEVTILARITSYIVESSKPYYDPLKDFISLNRQMRKSMGDRGKEFSPFYVDDNYRTIEILAIYK